ncbi:hypothetical protein TWF481_010959 [Arthrobotrys musiformis]|uniref:F-box domain-containing protein n=1 Tax=Arthrobotrys musiformis TaxID=47236 RepID=A0AAV9VX63_9PEZI
MPREQHHPNTSPHEHRALHIPEILGEVLSHLPFKDLKTTCRAVCRTWKQTVETLPGLKTYTKTGLRLDDFRSAAGENVENRDPVPELTEVAKECLDLFCEKAAPIFEGHPYWRVKETLSRGRVRKLEQLYNVFSRGVGGIKLFKPPPRGYEATICIFTPEYPSQSHKNLKQKRHMLGSAQLPDPKEEARNFRWGLHGRYAPR